MNNKYIKLAILGAFIAIVDALSAGVPLNNLQGTGGIAFNPLAYTAGLPWDAEGTNTLDGIVSKPQIGTWYVNLNDARINWWATSAALTFADRLEVSGGYGLVLSAQYQF